MPVGDLRSGVGEVIHGIWVGGFFLLRFAPVVVVALVCLVRI